MSTKSGLAAIAGVAIVAIAVVASASIPSDPTATVANDLFRLTISAPAGRHVSSEEIRGVSATLVYEGSDPSVLITHSAFGPINFAVAQLDGPHHTVPAWDLACKGSDLRTGDSITEAYRKTGGFNGPDDPDQPWLTAFIARQGLFLDPGRWTITAIAEFDLGGCAGGTPQDLRASITITVDPAPAAATPTLVPGS